MPTELNRIRELAGLQQEAPAAASLSPNQIAAFKKWYDTYSKMQSKDVYNYAKGIFKAHMETGQTDLDGESKQDPRGKAYDDLAKIFPDMDGDIEAIGHQLKSQGVDPLDMEAQEESAVSEAPAGGDQALANDLANYFKNKARRFKYGGDTGIEYQEMVDIAKGFRQGLDQGMEEINDLAQFEFSAHPFGGLFSNNEGDPEEEVIAILDKHGYTFKEKKHPEFPRKGLVTLHKKVAKGSAAQGEAVSEAPAVAELDDKQRTASTLKYSSDPRVAYFDKMLKRYGPKLMELIIDHSHVISNNDQVKKEKLKKYGNNFGQFMDRFPQMDGVEEDFIYMLRDTVDKGEEGLISFLYDRVEQAKKAGQFSKTSRLLDPDETHDEFDRKEREKERKAQGEAAAQPVNSSVDDTIQRARAQIESLEAQLKEDYKKFQGMKPYKPKKK